LIGTTTSQFASRADQEAEPTTPNELRRGVNGPRRNRQFGIVAERVSHVFEAGQENYAEEESRRDQLYARIKKTCYIYTCCH